MRRMGSSLGIPKIAVDDVKMILVQEVKVKGSKVQPEEIEIIQLLDVYSLFSLRSQE